MQCSYNWDSVSYKKTKNNVKFKLNNIYHTHFQSFISYIARHSFLTTRIHFPFDSITESPKTSFLFVKTVPHVSVRKRQRIIHFFFAILILISFGIFSFTFKRYPIVRFRPFSIKPKHQIKQSEKSFFWFCLRRRTFFQSMGKIKYAVLQPSALRVCDIKCENITGTPVVVVFSLE